ncbi:MAG: hypothetical protein ABIP78_02100 [Pyrinomonadaceae bacterium]
MASIQDLSDSELINVANQLISAMTADPAAYGTTPAQIAALTTLVGTFDTDTTAQIAALAASKAATATKESSRRPFVDAMRGHRDTAKASGATEAQMAATALPFGGEKVPPTATTPIGSVDTSQRLRHTISWTEATTPDNKRRPRGAMGAGIYVKLDDPPPTDEKPCTFLTVDSATPYVAQYDGADAGRWPTT